MTRSRGIFGLELSTQRDMLLFLVEGHRARRILVSDIAKKVLAVNRAPQRVNVYEIMSKPVLSVHPDMQVRYCARLFDRSGLTLAPVIDRAGEVLGLVNYDDLVLQGLHSPD